MSEYSVYIVRNPNGRLYIGLSDDVARRVRQHNDSESTWTSTRGPWALIWSKGGMDLSAARKLENLLKRQKGGAGLYRLTGLQPSSSGS